MPTSRPTAQVNALANQSGPSPMPVKPVTRVSVADAVHDQLRAAILSGTQPVGSLLAPELELATQAGVNRQAVREALQRLRQVGMLEIVHGGGARVLDWRVTGTLSLLIEAAVRPDRTLDPAITASLFRLRMVTLIDAIMLCIERRPDGLGDNLRGQVDAMRTCAETELAMRRSTFWETITVAGGNLAYRLVLNTQLAIAWRLPRRVLMSLLQGPEIVEAYAAVAEAIDHGDTVAAKAAARQILEPAVNVFNDMDADADGPASP